MNTENIETQNSFVLGQKYAFATASLVLGICCFFSLLGLEKAILAVVFGWLALRAVPAPILKQHRLWAKAGIAFGILMLIIVPILIIVFFDRLSEIVEILSKMNGGR
jgi:hypothetical protein